MLAVVLAAGLFPNAGTVQAQSSCPYGGCSTSSSIPVWEYVSILVVIAAGAIVALLFILRRRRPPRSTTVTPWAPGAAAAPPTAPGPTAPSAPTPPYVETPEDVGHAPPAVAPAAAVAAPPAAAGEAAPQAGSDIDSLMAELDKISTEILKKAPKKGAGGKDAEEPDTDSTGKSS